MDELSLNYRAEFCLKSGNLYALRISHSDVYYGIHSDVRGIVFI